MRDLLAVQQAFWRLPLPELQSQLKAGPDGLSAAEASVRLRSFGLNALRPARRGALFRLFFSRFRNPLVIILLVASGISALTGEMTSFLIISAMVLMSVTLDTVQEYRAGQAAERLKQSVAVRATVLRDGQRREIPLSEVVPGDVVLLAAGDAVPADGRLLTARDFFINQAMLTGEAYPVEKHAVEAAVESDAINVATNAVFWALS